MANHEISWISHDSGTFFDVFDVEQTVGSTQSFQSWIFNNLQTGWLGNFVSRWQLEHVRWHPNFCGVATKFPSTNQIYHDLPILHLDFFGSTKKCNDLPTEAASVRHPTAGPTVEGQDENGWWQRTLAAYHPISRWSGLFVTPLKQQLNSARNH